MQEKVGRIDVSLPEHDVIKVVKNNWEEIDKELEVHAKAKEEIENVSDVLKERINDTYCGMFGVRSSLSAREMLLKISDAMDEALDEVRRVDKRVIDKWIVDRKEKDRIESRRKAEEQLIAEQKGKTEKALKRANRTVTVRKGRPVVKRILPNHQKETVVSVLKPVKDLDAFLYNGIENDLD